MVTPPARRRRSFPPFWNPRNSCLIIKGGSGVSSENKKKQKKGGNAWNYIFAHWYVWWNAVYNYRIGKNYRTGIRVVCWYVSVQMLKNTANVYKPDIHTVTRHYGELQYKGRQYKADLNLNLGKRGRGMACKRRKEKEQNKSFRSNVTVLGNITSSAELCVWLCVQCPFGNNFDPTWIRLDGLIIRRTTAHLGSVVGLQMYFCPLSRCILVQKRWSLLCIRFSCLWEEFWNMCKKVRGALTIISFPKWRDYRLNRVTWKSTQTLTKDPW